MGSSRSPRAGSIAASTRAATADARASHPAHHERAPLRPGPTVSTVPARSHVIPLTTSGLHCGGSVHVPSGQARRHPAHHERAPLRPHGQQSRGLAGSSRSPRAGSIAAMHAPGAGLMSGSSRSPRAGSIAAGSRPSAEGSAAAVIPLTTSGLHCGCRHRGLRLRLVASSRSPRAGSIAAQHHGGHRAVVPGHPAHHERAPLRLAWPRILLIHAPVIPLTTSGLHCGCRARRLRPGTVEVIPLTTSGLHCGQLMLTRGQPARGGHPAHHERAPLRLPLGPVPEYVPRRSSRSPRAGSICGS